MTVSRDPHRLGVIVPCVLISLLQASFFALARPRLGYLLPAFAVAAATLALAWRSLGTEDERLPRIALLLCGVQLALFLRMQMRGTHVPTEFRLVEVSLMGAYFGTALALLLARTRRVAPANAMLLSHSLAVALVVGESAMGLYLHTDVEEEPRAPEWAFAATPDPDLGYYYTPNSTSRIYYFNNPRGYFTEADIRDRSWRLFAHQGNVAQLLFPAENPDAVRVAIAKTDGQPETWHIQLSQTRYFLRAKHRYILRFEARADVPRRMAVAVTQARAPFRPLGLYKDDVDVIAKWRKFQVEFTTPSDEDNARLYFDLGGNEADVEISAVSLRDAMEGRTLQPELPEKYFVSYRINSLGCRGRDYDIPRPSGTVRIVMLGDSFTLGAGVKEEDTVSAELERSLNQRAAEQQDAKTYEVINCGVSGYATEQERLFYERIAARYEPDIVLLVMVWNDDYSWVEEVANGYIGRQADPLESTLLLWNRVQKYRHERPLGDFSRSVTEIKRLQQAVQQRGARLGVVFFRNHPPYENESIYGKRWRALVENVTAGLEGTGIPSVDLADALYSEHTTEDLMVDMAVDLHPNEIAHRIAAHEVAGFLARDGLLPGGVELARPRDLETKAPTAP